MKYIVFSSALQPAEYGYFLGEIFSSTSPAGLIKIILHYSRIVSLSHPETIWGLSS
ncbi:MAG: hypothetical protein HY226_04445 [Candidatus Vogelbacteria bacterium]|nr:hypothetical protein [Candidatus Vogelbacteria bacterium]